ncbi:hypothetical protein [Blautia glucerasea]|nr:hypothetical protein [Blautia glucerasea]
MDYRKEIIELLNKIQSRRVLRYIWIIVSDVYQEIITEGTQNEK